MRVRGECRASRQAKRVGVSLVEKVKVMRSIKLRTWGLIAVAAWATGPSITSAERQGRVVPRTSMRVLRDVEAAPAIASSSSSVSAFQLPEPQASSELRRLSASGGVAGAPVGSTRVYNNEIAEIVNFYPPRSNQRMADDLTLAGGPCNAVYYSLAVAGLVSLGPPTTYNVHTELWADDPCLANTCVGGTNAAQACTSDAGCPGGGHCASATAIADTSADFTGVARDDNVYLLEAEFTEGAVSIPGTVWLAATFSTNNAGWIVGGPAETGSTQDYFSENDTDPNPDICALYNFTCMPEPCTPPFAGFWADVYCETTVPPNGACCDGTNCTQTTQVDCASPSVWRGAFTTCQPNACLTGACCTGVDFEECTDTNEPGCPSGLFRPGTVCLNDPCGLNFEVYRNDFPTGIFNVIDENTKFGDDLTLGAGAPCQLAAYEVLMAGDDTAPTFDARVELWTNNDQGTPTVDDDDIPQAVIPGTQRDFIGRGANFSLQRLFAGPFAALELPKKVWMVISTSTNNAGPIFAGIASIGFSQDGFAVFNDPGGPNAWTGPFQFPPNGYDPTNCPGAGCVPAGSFRAIVWCEGEPPMGACCNDIRGTCADNVLSTACDGRWMQDATCDSNPFQPSCGTHACCYPNALNPDAVVCQDLTPEECAGPKFEGSSAPGLFCVDVTCPRTACINRDGNCYEQHGTTGCDSAFCCEKVCADTPACCSSVTGATWSSVCAARARVLCSPDHCADALPLSSEGTYAFDNTSATTDGPGHSGCVNLGGDEQIEKDVWYCLTAPCTDTVFVRTCGQTTVDTKLAVYDGCTCPPGDAALLDCGDDRCGDPLPLQSTAVFHAVAGQSYLIRLGSYPANPPETGTGSMTIGCGPPIQPSCGGAGGCCNAEDPTVPGCLDGACCELVCGCDSYCCETTWDTDCATTGLGGSGCGADVLCPALCGNCPAGTVTFNDLPPEKPEMTDILDAGRPFPPDDSTNRLGVKTIEVTAPPGADLLGCWSVCETVAAGAANGIANITDNGGGQFTINLARPITTGAVTKITYLGNGSFARYIAHPANLNVDGSANATDVGVLVNALEGTAPLPLGLLSGDVDRSGAVTPADVLDAVGLLIGEGAYPYTIDNPTLKPVPNVNCP